MLRASNLIGLGVEDDHPLTVFESGDRGFFVDLRRDGSPLFTDVGGTTPATTNNDQISHFKSLGPDTSVYFSNANNFLLKTGSIDYMEYPTTGNSITASNLSNLLANAKGFTLCMAFYHQNGVGSRTPFVAWNGFDQVVFTEMYSNGTFGLNIKTPSISGGWWEHQTQVTNCGNQWIVITGTYDCTSGTKIIRKNGELASSSSWTTGDWNSNLVSVLFNTDISWCANEMRMAAAFAVNRVVPDNRLAKAEAFMKRRVGLA